MTSSRPPDWLELTREEPLDSGRPMIDAHHHLWREGEGLGGMPGYLSEDLLADVAGHNIVGSVYVECGVGYRRDGPEQLRSVGETEFAAAQACVSMKTRTPIVGIVGQVDLALGHAVQDVLDAHEEAANGLLRGVRQQLARGGHLPRSSANERAVREGISRLARNDYSLDVFALSTQLADLAKLAGVAPQTRVILNHLGVPVYRPPEARREEIMARWRDDLRLIAGFDNIFVKLGGIGMDSLFGTGWSKRDRPASSDEIVAFWGDDIRFCIDTFGPSRCLFESNFPVDRRSFSYTVLWNAFQKIALRYSRAEQDALFAGTAQRAYRLSSDRGSK